MSDIKKLDTEEIQNKVVELKDSILKAKISKLNQGDFDSNTFNKSKYHFAVRPKKHRPGRTRGGFKVKLRFQNKLVYVTFTTASPYRKRVRSEHLRRPTPTEQY